MKTPKRLGFSLVAALTAAVIAGAPALAEEPRMGGTLIYANNAGPGALDPQMSASLVELEVIHHMYEGLVTIDGIYDTAEMLAESVEIENDGRRFIFRLRQGVKFHDGSELTSEDVLATFERYARISPNAGALATVESYETPDPYTFIVNLTETNAVFVDVLKTPVYPFVILPASHADVEPRQIDPIGTGPFRLREWVRDSHLVIERFDDYVADSRPGPDGYAGEKTVFLDAVRYNFVPEANARVAAMLTGEADVTTSIPGDLLGRFDGQSAVEVISVFPFCQQYLIVHSQQPPTDNPLIRQAIRTVVNVDDLIAVTGNVARRNHSMVYPDGVYYGGEITMGRYDESDIARAQALLVEAGYAGEEIVLQSNTSYDYMRDSILVLGEWLTEAGMNVRVDITDWTTNASNMQQGTGGWNVSTTGFCSNPLLGPQQWQTMIYNFPHVQDDDVLDAAYEKFYTSLDFSDRREAWLTIEQQVLDQAYMIKVADRPSIRAVNTERVRGFRPYYMSHFWNVWLAQ